MAILYELAKKYMDSVRRERFKSGFKIAVEILKVVAAGTVIVGSFMAPNLAQSLNLFGFDERRQKKRYSPSDLSRALHRLKRRGAIRLVQTANGYALRITEYGDALLAQYELRGLLDKKPRQWDRHWRVVVFDIREERKGIREEVRNQLRSWGFYHLQDSVWVYPYECEKAIELMKTAFRARHDIYYLTVSKMAYDHYLRRFFRIPID